MLTLADRLRHVFRRKGDDDTLYVFLHLPKCPGTTLAHHIRENFRPEQTVRLYVNEPMSFINPKTGRHQVLEDAGQIDAYLASLTESDKREVRVIYGHDVFYGVEKLFGRPARYITFLREPVGRNVSWYNFFRMMHENRWPLDFPFARSILSESGEALEFEPWFANAPLHATVNNMLNHFMNRFLREGVSYENLGPEHVARAKAVLGEFHVVGTTETFDRHVPALYAEMRIRKFFPDQNISTKYLTAEQIEQAAEAIRARNQLDLELYEYARTIDAKAGPVAARAEGRLG